MTEHNPPIRARLEAIRDRHLGEMLPIYRDQPNFPTGVEPERWCQACEMLHPCDDFVDAVATLDALDQAPPYDDIVFYGDMAEWLGGVGVRARLVPDPSPRGDDHGGSYA